MTAFLLAFSRELILIFLGKNQAGIVAAKSHIYYIEQMLFPLGNAVVLKEICANAAN